MARREYNVKLNRNGDYWQASWYDRQGKRRRMSLGRIGEHQARNECERIEKELYLGLTPSPPRLSPLSQAAKIKVHLNRNGDYGQASWYDGEGQRRRESMGPIKDEESWQRMLDECAKMEVRLNWELKQRLKVDSARRAAFDVSRSREFKDIVTEWLEAKRAKVKPSTMKRYELIAGIALRHFGPTTRADIIRPCDAAGFVALLIDGYKQTTARKYYETVYYIFEDARKRDRVPSNPFDATEAVPIPSE